MQAQTGDAFIPLVRRHVDPGFSGVALSPFRCFVYWAILQCNIVPCCDMRERKTGIVGIWKTAKRQADGKGP